MGTASHVKPPLRSRAYLQIRHIAPGLIMAIILAHVSVQLGRAYPLAGGPVIAIVCGMAIRAAFGMPARYQAGLQWASKRVLQVSIALLGASLSLNQIRQVGPGVLGVLLLVILTACATALGAGRLLGVGWRMNSLLAIGTAICGASAIAALSPVVEAEETEISYSITTVFIGSILAMLAYPLVAHALGLSQTAFGIWAGTAINDTSSVVAAGFAYGKEAGEFATAVKLVRTLMLVPLVLAFALVVGRQHASVERGRERASERRRASGGKRVRLKLGTALPWFVIAFVALSGLRTAGGIPAAWADMMGAWARSLIVVALAAVGLTSNLTAIKQVSWKPLAVGLVSWFAVAAVSLAVVKAALGSLW